MDGIYLHQTADGGYAVTGELGHGLGNIGSQEFYATGRVGTVFVPVRFTHYAPCAYVAACHLARWVDATRPATHALRDSYGHGTDGLLFPPPRPAPDMRPHGVIALAEAVAAWLGRRAAARTHYGFPAWRVHVGADEYGGPVGYRSWLVSHGRPAPAGYGRFENAPR